MKNFKSIKSSKIKTKMKKKDLSMLSVDEFMESDFNETGNDSDSSMDEIPNQVPHKTTKKMGLKSHEKSNHINSESDLEDEDIEEDEDIDLESANHKKSLKKLKESDPEFYKFLEVNDKKLLEFNLSDSDSDRDDTGTDNKIHKPPDELEVASDESDYELLENVSHSSGVVTLKMVKEWQENLQTDRSVSTISCVIKAFHAALLRVNNNNDEDDASFSSAYKVDGSAVFNAVIQLCVLELQPALKKFLKLPPGRRTQPHKCKKWVKVKGVLKSYLTDLLKLLSVVTSENILSVLLKHLHQLTPFVASFPKVTKGFLKKLVALWATGDETTRVLAFLCLLRITTSDRKILLDRVLKMMYLGFVQNSKFVSPNTLPAVNFMRRSLTEMFALDEGVSYQHAFLYIRQLAINLRNAITLQKKEHRQAVCNWQFIQSLHLCTDLLGVSVNKPQLQPLIYPLVQVTIGTIKLVPTAQFFPLRFHCLQMLIDLSRNTGVFIPVLPFLLEILHTFDFNKRHKKVSMKPLDFTCILRVSKGQLQENGFKDAVIEKIYKQLLEYTANESHVIAFPDLVVSTTLQIKKFLKVCKNPNYCKKFKQVLDKIEENARYIESERKKVSFDLADRKAIDAWETTMKLKGTPLSEYYATWNKVNMQQIAKKATDNIKLGDFNLPTRKKQVKTARNEEGPVELFPSDDSDSDHIFGSEGTPQKKRRKKERKQEKLADNKLENNHPKIKFEKDDDVADIVEDFRFSASENDSD